MPCDADTPCCPVCGYDQSGLVASWTDQCPLRSPCSECGAEIDWVEVFRPELFEVLQFCEHDGATFPGACLRTGWRALRPGAFWRWVPRSQPLRAGRLIGAVVLGLVVWRVMVQVACLAVVIAFLFAIYATGGGGNYGYSITPLGHLVEWLQDAPPDVSRVVAVILHFSAGIVALTWAVLAKHRSVQARHIVRGWSYTLVSLCVPFAIGSVLRSAEIVLDYDGLWSASIVMYWLAWYALPVLYACWLWHCWSSFLRRYLRVQRPRATAAAYGLISALLTALVVTLYSIVTNPYS
ncbi:MAG: hypothetical protein H6810_02985 [Phycisphaeraceae bacterium]|nr:MAG: hypothetical protein H6810_02985 [Phycisphaeraceae bacterium]